MAPEAGKDWLPCSSAWMGLLPEFLSTAVTGVVTTLSHPQN